VKLSTLSMSLGMVRLTESMARDLDRANARAKAMGILPELQVAMRYETARCMTRRDRMLWPQQVLDLLVPPKG
jgi:hypothetical protein